MSLGVASSSEGVWFGTGVGGVSVEVVEGVLEGESW